MRMIAIFEDKPDGVAWIREQHAEAHFNYLEAHKTKIIIAGGLKDKPDSWWSGGLWIMEVTDEMEARTLIENDPYFILGLRACCKLMVWGKAPCYGQVQL